MVSSICKLEQAFVFRAFRRAFWGFRHGIFRALEQQSEGEMSAHNHAVKQDPLLSVSVGQTVLRGPQPVPALAAVAGANALALPVTVPSLTAARVPSLRVMPLQPVNPMRRFARVPTHAVGVFPEQR